MLQDSSSREPVSYVLFNTRFQTWFPKIHAPYHKWLFDVVLGFQSHELIVDLVQGLLARARWKNRKNILASANEIQANLPLITKIFHIQEMLDCIVFSSIDVRVIR